MDQKQVNSMQSLYRFGTEKKKTNKIQTVIQFERCEAQAVSRDVLSVFE